MGRRLFDSQRGYFRTALFQSVTGRRSLPNACSAAPHCNPPGYHSGPGCNADAFCPPAGSNDTNPKRAFANKSTPFDRTSN